MKLYIQVDENNKIIGCDTNKFGNLISVEVDEELFNSMKILDCSYIDGQIIYDEDSHNEQLEAVEKEKKYQESLAKFNEISMKNALISLSDADAYKVKYLYEEWKPDTDYGVGDRRINGDILYKCKQAHTSQLIYPPNLIPAIWDIISSEHQGTIDDPIPIPEPFSSMEYVKGKYYIEDYVIYLMNRDGMENGESISLTYKPSQLIGTYFEIV